MLAQEFARRDDDGFLHPCREVPDQALRDRAEREAFERRISELASDDVKRYGCTRQATINMRCGRSTAR